MMFVLYTIVVYFFVCSVNHFIYSIMFKRGSRMVLYMHDVENAQLHWFTMLCFDCQY